MGASQASWAEIAGYNRQQLVEERRAVKRRISAALRDARLKPPDIINAWTKAWVAWRARPDHG